MFLHLHQVELTSDLEVTRPTQSYLRLDTSILDSILL